VEGRRTFGADYIRRLRREERELARVSIGSERERGHCWD